MNSASITVACIAVISMAQLIIPNEAFTLKMGVHGKRTRKDLRRSKQLPVPKVDWTPYGPIRQQQQPKICPECKGRGMVKCRVCDGRAVVAATGHKKKNTVNMQRVIGSRWTSVEQRCGHRQYTVSEMKGSKKKKNLGFRMSNCCGPEEKRVHFWIEFEELRSKSMWRSGWTTLDDIKNAKTLNNGVLLDMKICHLCKGDRIIMCANCNGMGKIAAQHIVYD